ncbi:hypothetical protein RCL1_000797 [Eukaryota sp. TZLM3-RCL]
MTDLESLKRQISNDLKTIKYYGNVDLEAVGQGSPIPFLPVLAHCLLHFSTTLTKDLLSKGYILNPSNDAAFIQTLYKILRQEFDYNPVLSASQFLTKGFAEKRISMMVDIIRLIKAKYQQMSFNRTGFVVKVKEGEEAPRPQPRVTPSPVPKLATEFTDQLNPTQKSTTSLDVTSSVATFENQIPNSIAAIASTIQSINFRMDSALSNIEQRLGALEVRVKIIEEKLQ